MPVGVLLASVRQQNTIEGIQTRKEIQQSNTHMLIVFKLFKKFLIFRL